MMEFLRLEKESGVAVITVNRPKALNALNAQVFDELEQCLIQLKNDDEVGALIITGEGDKAFVAGADIKELAVLDVLATKEVSSRGQGVFRLIDGFPKPVIAAINGYALGGGCELAMACHIRLAADTAQLGLPEVTLGLIPGYGGTQRLPRIVGKGIALELMLTGNMVDAARAYEIGLVNEVVAPDELIAKAKKMAGKIMSRGPIAVRHALEAVHRGLDVGQIEGECIETNLFGMLASTEDTKEGLAAFIERRKPEFKGQ